MLNIAVFGSGKGSNCKAILRAIAEGTLQRASVRVVLSNNSAAGILDLARSYGIAALHMSQSQFSNEEAFVEKLLGVLRRYNTDLVVLAGYMKHVPAKVIHEYRNRIINIHPALLPHHGGKGMYGMHVHEAVLAAGDRVSGATVHIVNEEYDRGPILAQRTVAVEPDDTPETLAAKVLAIEHVLYPEVIGMLLRGEIVIHDTLYHS
jgi:phosphoribosylglycinamide formyltransferase 1